MSVIPFDEREGTIWFDGAMVPWREAKIHVLSHGLHYGSSVFEGERAYGGRIFKSREHSERLRRSAQLLAKGTGAMPIRRSPNGAAHTPVRGGGKLCH